MNEGDPALVDQAMAGWTPGQIKCRANQRHSWKSHTVTVHQSRGGSHYEIIERCPDCFSRRWRLMSMAGYWLTKWKTDRYSEGYLLPKGSGGLSEVNRADLRLSDVASRRIRYVNDDEE